MYTMITNLYKYTYGLRLVKKKNHKKPKVSELRLQLTKKIFNIPKFFIYIK